MKTRLFLGLILVVVLLSYGVVSFPQALHDPSGLIGVCVILISYGAALQFWFRILEDKYPHILRLGLRSGVFIGLIFIGEMLLEYILLPADNSKMGLWEYGAVLAVFFSVSLWAAYQTTRFRDGVLAAFVSAMIGSIIWLIALLAIFYLFHGSVQQTQVFRAEGNFEDFTHSGMTDFDAFIMQDFWGAGFFHSILLPMLAGILGSVGSLFGIFFAWIRNRNQKTIQ